MGALNRVVFRSIIWRLHPTIIAHHQAHSIIEISLETTQPFTLCNRTTILNAVEYWYEQDWYDHLPMASNQKSCKLFGVVYLFHSAPIIGSPKFLKGNLSVSQIPMITFGSSPLVVVSISKKSSCIHPLFALWMDGDAQVAMSLSAFWGNFIQFMFYSKKPWSGTHQFK